MKTRKPKLAEQLRFLDQRVLQLQEDVNELRYGGWRPTARKLARGTAKLIGLCILAGSLSYVVFTVAKLVGWKGGCAGF